MLGENEAENGTYRLVERIFQPAPKSWIPSTTDEVTERLVDEATPVLAPPKVQVNEAKNSSGEAGLSLVDKTTKTQFSPDELAKVRQRVTEETEDVWYPQVVEDEALQLNEAQHAKSSENRVASPSDIGVCEKKRSEGEVEIQQPTE